MKFRASFSILNQWVNGNFDEAIKQYFKLSTRVTPQMEDGKRYHDEWANYIEANKHLPPALGGKQLVNPQVELKLVAQLSDWLELVGRIDCIDAPSLYEFKTGQDTSTMYANTWQPGVYALLAATHGIYVSQAIVVHYNQYRKETDISFRWVTDKYLRDSAQWVETASAEMHHYLVENDLYNNFQTYAA